MAGMSDMIPPDYSSDIGKLRALIPDTEQVDFTDSGTPEYIFPDQHLAAFLALHLPDDEAPTAHIFRAAADAVRAIAVSEALISKVIKTEDLQTDGAKVANALLAQAQRLAQEADRQEEEASLSTAFTIVDFQPQPPEVLHAKFWHGFPDVRAWRVWS